MTEYIVGEIYEIVCKDCNYPEQIYGIFKEKQSRQYIIQDFRRNIVAEPEYEIITDYFFIDNANPNRTFHIECWEIENDIVEIIPIEIPIK